MTGHAPLPFGAAGKWGIISFIPKDCNMPSTAIQPPQITKPRAQLKALYRLMGECRLCPRECATLRMRGAQGVCRSGVLSRVASITRHFGEEPPISGTRGSGTVFFSNCNMRCVFCQNFPISQMRVGRDMTAAQLAGGMLRLQKEGAHNVNFVTPTHYAAQAAHAVYLARRKGFSLPVVWNTSGYEKVETLRLLEGFVDIYLCDYRYATPELAKRYSRAEDYPRLIEPVIEEMLRQVGHFHGERGVIIRHLVMPGHLEETQMILNRIRQRFGPAATVSFMTQYFPAHKASRFPPIDRRLTAEEGQAALGMLTASGLENGWTQEEDLASGGGME